MADIRKMIENLKEGMIVFLLGENEKKSDILYTDEELYELYNIKKDIEKFPKHSSG